MANKNKTDYIVTLAGNPNTGKSTIFNSLTGLRQHTGNWAGKTVKVAEGYFNLKDKIISVVDLPGTYSIYFKTLDEENAIDFISKKKVDATVIVLDSTCLERSLIFALQVMMKEENVILVFNLIDEARKKGIDIDEDKIRELLKVPIVLTSGKTGLGIVELKNVILDMCEGNIKNEKLNLFSDEEDEEDKNIKIIRYIDFILEKAVTKKVIDKSKNLDRKIDNIIMSKYYGIPIMLVVLMFIFWLTIIGTNYPSQLLQKFFFSVEDRINNIFIYLGINDFIRGLLVDGLIKTLGWVISVMFPPMAIFFPIFALLEDWGFLPRIVFNLDNYFKKVKAHGKQVLTMSMGFGCNASGIVSCRIIDSTRDRILAILTNNFVPCNGRFPIIIVLASVFFAGGNNFGSSIIVAFIVLLTIIFSVFVTLLISYILSSTILKGLPSDFILELPPYRKPQISRILIRSFLDRTIFILGRAIVIAAPAGLIIWFMQNTYIDNKSILFLISNFLDPFGKVLGMDGIILTAFIFGLPANEIVFPIIIMMYSGVGVLTDIDSVQTLGELLRNNGWTWVTAICTIIFSLNHFPCGTTLLTIKKETNSLKWTVASFLIPTIVGIFICFIVNALSKLTGF